MYMRGIHITEYSFFDLRHIPKGGFKLSQRPSAWHLPMNPVPIRPTPMRFMSWLSGIELGYFLLEINQFLAARHQTEKLLWLYFLVLTSRLPLLLKCFKSVKRSPTT